MGPRVEQLRGQVARIHSETHEDVGGQLARIDEMRLVSGLAGKLDRLVAVGKKFRGNVMPYFVQERGGNRRRMMGAVEADQRTAIQT